MQVRSLGWEYPLVKGMATHSSILAWRIPLTEEPGGYGPQDCTELDMTEATQHAQKQPKYPSTTEWIKKVPYVYTMKDYSAKKMNEILPFATTWMDLEGIILS